MPKSLQPMAALDSKGEATILNYNLPESISYSGLHFLQVDLPQEAFNTIVNDSTQADAAPGRGAHSSDGQAPSERALVAPPGVTVDTSSGDGVLRIHSSQPLSERLQRLTKASVDAAAAAGRQTVLFTNVVGDLDYRAVPMRPTGGGYQRPIPPTHLHPWVQVHIANPPANSQIYGPKAGVTFTVSGTSTSLLVVNPIVSVSVDGGKRAAVSTNSKGGWSHQVTITDSGVHTIEASINGYGELPADRSPVSAHTLLKVGVTLDQNNPDPVVVLPTLTVSAPRDNTTIVNADGVATVTVEGTVIPGSGGAVTGVQVEDMTTGAMASVTPAANGSWSTQLVLDGARTHDLTVIATDSKGQQSIPTRLQLHVLASQPLRRIKNRLMLVETFNLSSFLGTYGAGRVVKTFTLLPGEETTISMKSWTQSDDSRKSAASIVDSNASEAASSFDDALSAEQTNSVSAKESSSYSINAKASAAWGFGSIALSGSKSGTANSARAEAVKSVTSATRKHSMKASSNRNVTVNTEYNVTEQTGVQESTTRKISNINASRTLNFVFRQMNQEHIVLVHLTHVRVGYYTEDLALKADGTPAYITDSDGKQVLDIRRNYVEYGLPQLQALLEVAVTAEYRDTVRTWIMTALANVPDYEDKLHTLYETVTPTKDGTDYPDGKYMRFPPHLQSQYPSPSGEVITVPGLILGVERLVMRTEGIMVDCVLGQGEGLDAYSKGLQQVTIAERTAAVAAANAEVQKQELARKLVATEDSKGAAIFAQVFPQPTLPAATPPGSPSSNGAATGTPELLPQG